MEDIAERDQENTGWISGGKSDGPVASVSRSMTPRKVFFTCGSGSHDDELISFELALRDAGVERFNLVPVSSIFPPGCEIITVEDGLEELNPGQVVFCVMAKKSSREEGKQIFASIGAAVPDDPSLHGYLTEYSGYYMGEDVGKHAEKMAEYMLETAFGIRPGKTFNITKISEVEKCTTVVSLAIFVM